MKTADNHNALLGLIIHDYQYHVGVCWRYAIPELSKIRTHNLGNDTSQAAK